MKTRKSKKFKTAQDIQDEIFHRMSAEQKLKLASDFSMFLLKLNQIGQSYELRRTSNKNRKNSR